MSSHAASHGHPSVLAHHFDTIEQQRSTMRLGMWMFLVTEALFFGGAFCAYAANRVWYPRDFEAGSSQLNVFIAGINSLLLLTSSLTITLAIHAAQEGKKSKLFWLLTVTILLAVSFLGMKAYEYYSDYEEALVPGLRFDESKFMPATLPSPDAPTINQINPDRVKMFFMFYYIMTGLHVLHMIVGIGVMVWLWLKAYRGEIHEQKFLLIEITSLYWHFVDLVWLFIVPALYLAGIHH